MLVAGLACLLLAAAAFLLQDRLAILAGLSGRPASLALIVLEGILAGAAVALAYAGAPFRSALLVGIATAVSFVALSSIVVAVSPPSKPLTAVIAEPVAWTQFGFGESPPLIARVLIDKADGCPSIDVGGSISRMIARPDPRADVFGKLCETRMVFADGLKVRIWQGSTVLLDQDIAAKPQRVVILGDTGCRVTDYTDQGCGDRQKWPFPHLANVAAEKRPDLILHLGDYYYREMPCQGSSTNCVPGPFGDREEAWRAEFFTPARAAGQGAVGVRARQPRGLSARRLWLVLLFRRQQGCLRSRP